MKKDLYEIVKGIRLLLGLIPLLIGAVFVIMGEVIMGEQVTWRDDRDIDIK